MPREDRVDPGMKGTRDQRRGKGEEGRNDPKGNRKEGKLYVNWRGNRH